MKKAIAFVTSLMIVMALSACGPTPSETVKNDSEKTTKESVPVNSVDDEEHVTTKAPEKKEQETTTITEALTEAETEPEEEIIEETETTEAETVLDFSQLSDIKEAIENGDYSLVTPAFKATMDEYETFYDEYIGFMKKYASGDGDYLSMLNDYMKMVERLGEWEEKIGAMDDDDTLSAADQAYYLVVTSRIMNKSVSALE
ncbi:MAG: hypothetical protein IKH71_02900 [Oscillospiraceae bacterium]|nr:hypothetical protein [Oscillospiraceae bacterium]MBR6835831.1 hypothetical protein [Oscillospiraceae bacterium]